MKGEAALHAAGPAGAVRPIRPLPLVLSAAILLLTFSPVPTAEATIRVCFLPVDVNCFWWNGERYEHCDVYVAVPGGRPACGLDDLVRPTLS